MMGSEMEQEKSAKWDARRFIRTLAYFRAIPFLGSIGWLEKFFSKQDQEALMEKEMVLVAGATGGLGKRVVRRLLEHNYRVRALVRDIEKGRALLGDTVELVVGDITKPQTLTSELMANVKAVICCTAVRVQPVEGDTPDRAKYYQGVKFYQPEVVGDTPEAVEYQGVKNLAAAANSFTNSDGRIIFNFHKPSEDLKSTWGAVDDVVMGGVSESSIRLANNTALFTGNVSTENSGGFASVRTRNFDCPLNLSQYKGIELRVKGDGKRYKFILRTETKWDGIAYSYSFDTANGEWTTVRIPFSHLTPVFRAKTLENTEPFASNHIYALQLMLSKFEYDKALNPKFEPGPFQLQVESIKAYGGPASPQFILVSSAGVTRPGRPGINLEEEPPAVRMNDQLGGILTWKLKGEDSVRHSGIPYTIIRPCALTEEPGGQTLVVNQGDNLKGKVSREDVAELCVQALAQPKACNVTFEVKGEERNTPFEWEALLNSLQPDKYREDGRSLL